MGGGGGGEKDLDGMLPQKNKRNIVFLVARVN